MSSNFEWADNKKKSHQQKHRIAFEDATICTLKRYYVSFAKEKECGCKLRNRLCKWAV
jgi:uncharacterized DUF497 family protein